MDTKLIRIAADDIKLNTQYLCWNGACWYCGNFQKGKNGRWLLNVWPTYKLFLSQLVEIYEISRDA